MRLLVARGVPGLLDLGLLDLGLLDLIHLVDLICPVILIGVR